jgi:hypothetical protein
MNATACGSARWLAAWAAAVACGCSVLRGS